MAIVFQSYIFLPLEMVREGKVGGGIITAKKH